MLKIMSSIGIAVSAICSIVFLVKHVVAMNRFLRVLREDYKEKWNELGGLQSHGLSFNNKKARANIDTWIKSENDKEYDRLKDLYSPVSKSEISCAISIVLTIIFIIMFLSRMI